MKAEKLAAEKPAEIKKDNAAPARQTTKQDNNQTSAAPAAAEKRKLPWELVFLFVVMGLTMIIIALKAFSII
ncbi:MAG TPA: hypothetical protein VHO43_10840 [Ignavibacteriales bacterium]|nr:hypothetical protein [Ignavibacteriales bacterium]